MCIRDRSFNAYVANSSYWAFQKLGQYYHVGELFMICLLDTSGCV